MSVLHALSQLKAKNLDKGKYADGRGLWLIKYNKAAGRWMLRLHVEGKRREMGLGPWPDVSIAEARERAALARRRLRDGVDPIEERKQLRQKSKRLTVAEAVEGCFKARQAELKGDGAAGRWMSPLSTHVLPNIGELPIEELDQHELKKLLSPIWHKQASVASKALSRINLTLKHAAALGLDVDLQAPLKAKALLGKQRNTIKHIPSLPYQEAPKFYRWLSSKSQTSAVALRFLILTVARVSEVRLATFSEIDGDVWTLAPERTKASREHRVPLSPEAIKVSKLSVKNDAQEFLFPTSRGSPMTDVTMGRFLERSGHTARPHGFRATFRTWVEECTDTSYEVKETALGHQVGSDVERAYQRSDLLDKRRVLLKRWAEFLTG
jgi:integrase